MQSQNPGSESLHDRGVLDPAISQYLPSEIITGLHVRGGVDRTPSITIRHLASHTSGLPDFFERRRGGPSLYKRLRGGNDRAWTFEEILRITREEQRAHFDPQDLSAPRQRARYSDTGFQLLIQTLQQVTGRSFTELLAERITKPLSLTQTWHPASGPRDTSHALPLPLHARHRPVSVPQTIRSSNDLYSTTDDLITFERALLVGSPFRNPETRRLLIERRNRLANAPVIRYGLGTMIFRVNRIMSPTGSPVHLVGHSGSTGTWLFTCPELGVHMAGTVDQTEAQSLPFSVMAKVPAPLGSLRAPVRRHTRIEISHPTFGGTMKYLHLEGVEPAASNIVLGLMRIADKSDDEIRELYAAARDAGITMIDHANVYGGDHLCERRFAEAVALTPSERTEIVIQTKAGIVKTENGPHFDFSYDELVREAERSLTELNTDYLDVLLLHRTDALMEPEEVARAFDELHASGKVRAFGVSNQTPRQMELLRAYVTQPLVANQLQLSITHCPIIAQGVAPNMVAEPGSVVRDGGGILDYCRLTNTTIQAWSPFQKGFFDGVFLGDAEYPELNAEIQRIAAKYGVTDTAIAVAWITRHPANMQVVLGTTNPQRVSDAAAGSEIPLTRAEWYQLFRLAGHKVP